MDAPVRFGTPNALLRSPASCASKVRLNPDPMSKNVTPLAIVLPATNSPVMVFAFIPLRLMTKFSMSAVVPIFENDSPPE